MGNYLTLVLQTSTNPLDLNYWKTESSIRGLWTEKWYNLTYILKALPLGWRTDYTDNRSRSHCCSKQWRWWHQGRSNESSEKMSESTRIPKVLPRFEVKLNFNLFVGEWKTTGACRKLAGIKGLDLNTFQ